MLELTTQFWSWVTERTALILTLLTFAGLGHPRSTEESTFVKRCTFLEEGFEFRRFLRGSCVPLPHPPKIKNHHVREFRARLVLLCELLFSVNIAAMRDENLKREPMEKAEPMLSLLLPQKIIFL